MSSLRAFCLRFTGLFFKDRKDGELAEELESHLQMHAEDNLRAGMSPAEARRDALIKLGGLEQTKERYRQRRGVPWFESLVQDLRIGTRMLRKNPGFTLAALVTLALGIGANTAIFSMVNSMLLRPLPVRNPSEIVVPFVQQEGGSLGQSFSVPDYRDMKAASTGVFSGVTAQRELLDGLSWNGQADRVFDLYVTGNFFSVLGVKPAIGRLIVEPEGQTVLADPVMVLSYRYWKTRFGGDPNIVGRRVSVDGQPVTVVGVAPEGFYGVNAWANVQAYLPLGMAPISGVDGNDFLTNRRYRPVTLLGRLRPGVSLRQARASLGVLADRLSKDNPKEDAGLHWTLFPELDSRLGDPRPGRLALVSGVFLGLAAVVFLVSCFNVVNLLNVRARARQHEIAVRAALGAERGRLIRQSITETALLVVGGGAIGIMLGAMTCSAADSLNVRTELPVRLDFSFDWQVLLNALASTLIMALIVAIAPAVRASHGNLNRVLRGTGPRTPQFRQRVGGALVVAQVGGSIVLLVAAGLFIRSLIRAQHTDLGFDPSHVVNFTMDPLLAGYHRAQGTEFFKSLTDRLRALPGVVSVSTALSPPMGYVTIGDALAISDYEPPQGLPPIVNYNTISPNYFEVMRISVKEGRSFTGADDEGTSRVAIINEAFGRQYWPNRDPIGRTFKLASDPQHILRIVGVVGDVRYQGIAGPAAPYFFIPFLQRPWDDSWETVQIRTSGPPESMIPEVRRALSSFAPGEPVWDVESMDQALYTMQGLLFFQTGARLAGLLGALGLALTIVGVYGVISYATAQRMHEIGIRMALGAQRSTVVKMVIGEGLKLSLVGAAFGIGGAFMLMRFLSPLLFGIRPTDPLTFTLVVLVLLSVAVIASYVPARRAAKVDPMVALRYE